MLPPLPGLAVAAALLLLLLPPPLPVLPLCPGREEEEAAWLVLGRRTLRLAACTRVTMHHQDLKGIRQPLETNRDPNHAGHSFIHDAPLSASCPSLTAAGVVCGLSPVSSPAPVLCRPPRAAPPPWLLLAVLLSPAGDAADFF